MLEYHCTLLHYLLNLQNSPCNCAPSRGSVRELTYSCTGCWLGTRRRRMVTFTPRPLYPREKSPSAHRINGQVDFRADPNALAGRKISYSCRELILQSPVVRSVIQPLYRLPHRTAILRRCSPFLTWPTYFFLRDWFLVWGPRNGSYSIYYTLFYGHTRAICTLPDYMKYSEKVAIILYRKDCFHIL